MLLTSCDCKGTKKLDIGVPTGCPQVSIATRFSNDMYAVPEVKVVPSAVATTGAVPVCFDVIVV
jgi:hypothetical protein